MEHPLKVKVVAGLSILILCSLIGSCGKSPLGISAYKEEANKQKCIIQLETVQKLIISYANINEIDQGDAVSIDVLVTPDYLQHAPECPSGGNYTSLGKVPDKKTAFLRCDKKGHVPAF